MLVEKVSVNKNELPGGFVYIFIGPPKTGKTTEVAKWRDSCLLIDANLGSDLVECNRITVTSINPPKEEQKDENGKIIIRNGKPLLRIIPPEERGYVYRTGPNRGKPMPVYSVSEVLTHVRQNLEQGTFPYKAIAIDTMGDINEWIEEIVINEMGLKSMGEAAYGGDWGRARSKNLDIIKRFGLLCRKYGIDFIQINHSKPTTTIGTTVQLSADLPRGLTTALNGRADVIGYVSIDKSTNKAVVSFQAYDERQVGSRFEALAGKTIPFSWTSIENEVKKHTIKQKETENDK